MREKKLLFKDELSVNTKPTRYNTPKH